MASAVVPASAVPPPPPAPPPIEATLPRGSAVLASVDLARLGSAEALRALLAASPSWVEDVARVLGLQPGSPAPGWLSAAGIDEARPVAIAVLGATPEDRGAIAALRALVPAKAPLGQPTSGGFVAAVHDFASKVGVLVQGRALIPALDPARVKKAISALLLDAGWVAEPGGGYVHGDLRVEVDGRGATVVIDFALGRKSREALVAVRSRPPGAPRDEPPEVGEGAARLTYSPVALADLSFAANLEKIDEALSGGAIDAALREPLAAEGLWEDAQAYVLAGDERGAYFDRIDFSGSYPRELVIRAEPGPAFVAPPDEAWKASPSIAAKGPTLGASDVSIAFAQAWPFPGVAPGQGVDAGAFRQLLRSSGWGGPLVALPSAALVLLALPVRLRDAFASSAPVLRFERVGSFRPVVKQAALREVYFGVLPEGTPRRTAECALAKATPCRKPLGLGATLKQGGFFVRLAAVEKRFVVLIGADRAAVEQELVPRSVGPAWVDLPTSGDLTAARDPDRPDQSPHLAGSIGRRGTTIEWRFARP